MDLRQDLVDAGGPEKRLRLLVVLLQILFDGLDEFANAVKHTPAEALLTQFSEPTLDEIEPGGSGGRGMGMEAPMLGQPVFDARMRVRGVVIDDQMQV